MDNIRRLFAIVLTVAALSVTQEAWGQDRISAFVEADGRIVFTNLAIYSQPALEFHIAARNPTTLSGRSAASDQANLLDSLINGISARHGVDPTLVRSVIEIESNFNRHAVSPMGAMGLMQLIPATGARFGVHDFFDPAQNIDGGVRYLRFLLEMFQGNLDLSLAAYNSGENRVARLGRIPDIRETQDYVRKVKSAYGRRGGPGATVQSAVNVLPPTQTTPEAVAERPRQAAVVAQTSRAISSTVDARGVFRFSNVE
jgi:soluble lytic murein transglycosylase-like protein